MEAPTTEVPTPAGTMTREPTTGEPTTVEPTTMESSWITALRKACAETTQAAVARKLGVSPAMISQALKGVYKGDIARLQTLVEGELMAQVVDCPVIGPLLKHRCMEHQTRDRRFATANPLKMQLYRACRSGCPHSKLPRDY